MDTRPRPAEAVTELGEDVNDWNNSNAAWERVESAAVLTVVCGVFAGVIALLAWAFG